MSLSTVGRIALSRTAMGAALGRLPLLQRAYIRHAASRRDSPGLQWGVFETFEEAVAAAPPSRLNGWDNAAAAQIWTGSIAPVRSSSYPLFFWLRELLQPGCRVLDFGGSIGLTYYGYRRLVRNLPDLHWTVVELPHLVEEGRRIAAREAVDLRFETDAAAAGVSDVLVAAGVLQFMPRPIPGLLEGLTGRPAHILLNKVALTRGADFWTLHNFGPAITPYHVFNEADFLRYFADHGYRVVDRWDVMDMSCDIPFHPKHSVSHFDGFHLEAIG